MGLDLLGARGRAPGEREREREREREKERGGGTLPLFHSPPREHLPTSLLLPLPSQSKLSIPSLAVAPRSGNRRRPSPKMENEHSYANIRLSKNANLEEGDNMATESEEAMKSQELAGSVRGEIFVYRQDVVICPKYEGLLGVVTEVAGDADSEGSITDSDSEDEENEANANSGGDANGSGDGDGDGGNANGDVNCGEGYDTLPDGQVRVIWADASETAENVIDVAVVDRTFLHGDIVALASDPTGQLGLVVDVDIRVVLLDSDKKETRQVSSKELKRVREPLVGDYVILGPWLGRVDDVLDNVTVLFDDGSICKVVKADPLRLKPLVRSVSDDASCPFYPGQRVKGVSSSVFKSSRWLSGLWKANRLEGTVIKVEAASVVVYWIASAHLGMGTNSSVPSEEQDPKNLTLLSCFSYANWQLGDWCHLPSRPSQIRKESVEGSSSHIEHHEECSFGEHAEFHMNSCLEGPDDALDGPGSVLGDHQAVQDEFMSGDPEGQELEGKIQLQGHDLTTLHETNKIGECGSCSSSSSVSKEQTHESWPAYRKKLRKVFFKREKKPRKREESFDRALSIVKITTKVDVAWQDGTREYGLESKTLIPINTPNDHEFFPEQYVVENATGEDDPSEAKRVGVVRSLNSKERTVCVRWLKRVSSPEDLREFDIDEIVSAYELDEHPDYDYCYGDVVVRLSPVSVPAATADCGSPVEQLEQHASMGEAKANQDEVEQTGMDGAYEDFSILSWVGNITGLQDGDIEVTWADGMVSKVGPQAVFVVGREDDSDSFDGGSEISDDAASWETVDENDVDKLDDAEKESDKQSPSDNNVERENQVEAPPEESTVGISGPLSVPLAALGFVSRLATGLFSRDRKQSSPSETEPGTSEVSDIGADEGELSNDESNDVGSLSAPDVSGSAERDAHMAASEDGEPMDTSSSVDSSCSFKHFDIAESSLDHHFVASVQNSGERKWAKKVQKDWSILEKNLPDAIYVRVFEDRMDLLRAVIVGACGTPYQDGLFFFDFYLPPEYPQVPPSAYYHSGGLRVNPNLYVDGKVCLSLLNTWTGRGNEVWDPSSSSILQVLVSLQGLVLNSKPYFNEAGYEKQVGTIEGEKNALPYNEHTYLLNLKSMLFLLRRPPMHFEGFVKDHFRSRGQYILKACEAYMEEGCTIGSLTKDACMTEKSGEHPCSVGFKLMLGKILPRLMSALTEAGVDCRQFKCLRRPDSLPQS